MNEEEGDYDVHKYTSNPSNTEITADDESDDDTGANDQDGGNINKIIRHSPQQIQQLKNFFKDCPHPTGEQTSELGQKLNLETKQIKFWFRYKRAQMKVHKESYENKILRQEQDTLRAEQEQLKQLLMRRSCMTCEVGSVVQPLRDENARLKQEIDEAKSCLKSLIQMAVSPYAAQASSSLTMPSQGRNTPHEHNHTTSLVSPSVVQPGEMLMQLIELATKAMTALIMMGNPNSSLWKIDPISKRETLSYERFSIKGLVKPAGYVVEASRETGLVSMDCLALVKTLTTNKWINIFAPIVSVVSTRRLIPTCLSVQRNDSLDLIEAEFHVLYPLVPKRQVKFLRYSKKLKEGLWVVVDFTPPTGHQNFMSNGGFNRLPSGLIIEDMANGYSKVTWIEQAEYERSKFPQIYQLLIGSGIGLGAKRWLTTLQRHCENLSNLWNINLAGVYQGLSSNVAAEILKLAERMTLSYHKYIIGTHVENEGQNMRLTSRKNMNVRGEPTGINVLSAATSVWFPVNQKTMFDYLSNKSFRGQWDFLINGTSIEETTKIEKSRTHNNYVSLHQIIKQDSPLSVLQETWNDASGALLVYAPLETDSLEEAIRGEASDFLSMIPPGFSIVPDGGETNGGGCLVTIGYQILVNTDPFVDVSQDNVNLVENLMAGTIDNIKSALSISP